MRVTLRRINQTYFRVVTEAHPLLVELGPVEVSSIDAAGADGSGRVVFEVCNESAASKTYGHMVNIDRTLQQALVSDEEKAGRRAVLLPIFRPPSYVPAGPRLTAQLLATTRCFQQQQQQQHGTSERKKQARGNQGQEACSIDKLRVTARARVVLDIVGLRCCGDTIWTYDVAVSSVLLLLTPVPVEPPPAAAVHHSLLSAADEDAAAKQQTQQPQQYPFSNDAGAHMDSYLPEEESEWEVPVIQPQ